jgi:hypothetical protein
MKGYWHLYHEKYRFLVSKAGSELMSFHFPFDETLQLQIMK